MEDGPFGPWRLARTSDEVAAANARPLAGHWLDEFALIYDEAYQVGGALPDEVDRQTMENVAFMLGRNRAEEREPWPDDAPSIFTVRRTRAMAKGVTPPGRDDPIGDDEYAELLASVKGGSRKVRR